MTNGESTIHRLRWVAGSALAGTVVFGAFLSWIPGFSGYASEVGAIIGVGAGVLTAFRSDKNY